MARYIDTEQAIHLIENDALWQIYYSKSDAIDCINATPTAYVQEVSHGKWDEIRDAYGKLEGWIHRDCGRFSMAMENYCPHCGAIMKGGDV